MFTIYDSQLNALGRPFAQKKRQKIISDLMEAAIGKVYDTDSDIIVEDSKGNKTMIRFNDLCVPEKIIKPSGIEYGFTYDETGRLVQLLYPGNERVEWIYEDNLLKSVVINNCKLLIEYDDVRRINALIYPDMKKQTYKYHGAEQLHELTKRGGGKRKFEMTCVDDKIVYKNTDELQRVTCFECDQAGNIVKVVFPDKSVLERRFHDELQVEQIILRNSEQTTICYHGVIIEAHSNEGRVNLFSRPSNFLEAVEDENSTIIFCYDGKGNLLQEIAEDSQIVLDYDADNLLTKTTYPSGLEIDYTYDRDGRLSSIGVYEKKCFFTYKENDTIAAIHYPNRLTEFTNRTILSGIESIVLSNEWQELLSGHQYKYNDLFQLTRYYRQESDLIKHDCHFIYDADGRITHCMDVLSGDTEKYHYDDKGNMLIANGTNYKMGSMDQPTATDANGYVISINGLTLSYTSTGLVKTAVRDDHDRWTYCYDGLGRRIEKYSITQKYSYQWLGNKLISEQYNSTLREYIYNATDIFPLGFIENSKLYWLHRDVRGAVCTVTNENGNIVWSATYDAFGNATIVVSNIRQPWRLLNQYCDDETGLYYNGARYYCPAMHTYLSLDPHWYKPEASHYSYCLNDPWNRVCATGTGSSLLPVGAAILDSVSSAGLWRPDPYKEGRRYRHAIPGWPVLFSDMAFGSGGFSDTASPLVAGAVGASLIEYLLKSI